MLELRSKLTPRRQMDLTSLVDVMFILLIFFILSYKEIEVRGHRIVLPEDRKGEVLQIKENGPIIIKAYRSGELLLQNETVTTETLAQRLAEIVSKRKVLPEAIIDGEGDLNYQRVIHLIDICKIAGIRKINLHTQKKKEK